MTENIVLQMIVLLVTVVGGYKVMMSSFQRVLEQVTTSLTHLFDNLNQSINRLNDNLSNTIQKLSDDVTDLKISHNKLVDKVDHLEDEGRAGR